MVTPEGIEPSFQAPQAYALSVELWGQRKARLYYLKPFLKAILICFYHSAIDFQSIGFIILSFVTVKMSERLNDDRIEDYTGGKFHRTSDEVRDGIAHRVKMASPGDEIDLRHGTCDLFFDEIKDITWGRVFDLLVKEEVLTFVDGRYFKSAVSFGVCDGVPEVSIKEPIERGVAKECLELDIYSRDGYSKLIKKFATEFCRILIVKNGFPDLTLLIDVLVEDLANVSYGKGYFFGEKPRSYDSYELFLKRKNVIFSFLDNLKKYSCMEEFSSINKDVLNSVADDFEYYIFSSLGCLYSFDKRNARGK